MKINSLHTKSAVIFAASMLLLLVAYLVIAGYSSYQRAIYSAQRLMEVGPGYLSEQTSTKTNEDISIATGLSIQNVLEDFNPLENVLTSSGVDNVNQLAWYQIKGSQLGTITLYETDFPATIVLSNAQSYGSRLFYYQSTSYSEDIVLIASLDQQSILNIRAVISLFNYIWLSIPVIAIFSGLFGWLISYLIVKPIREIARTAETISEHDLSQRVNIKSNDEVGSLARSFNRMADRLDNAFQLQRRFVSDAAHELRTPLASVKTAVTHSLSGKRSISQYKELTILLSQRLEALENLINDLLFLSRADESKSSNSQHIDLSQILELISEAFTPLFQDKNIHFTMHTTNNLYIMSEQKPLLRLLGNLLENAAKNTPSGGTVILTASTDSQHVKIEISDTGTGIAQEHLPHIFERFYHVQNGEKDEGTGLGLSICQSIVTTHNGQITAESELGHGSIFTVIFPVVPASIPNNNK
ncbi:sensor histidine kinase [Dehalococcoides mccartyi]|uniref:histidine kinase n=1 Tax=Dehalococcoides mccartyi (strain CBDB1) TaxID=255470 RepID=A0A916P5L1_DEHMC|nr:HAMP domain-containing sensor histidine kinase [Dehalococcoides mccartyi]CAI83535.1 sensor histidine kinase [Dehalococcoides mccartyi CBDB1]